MSRQSSFERYRELQSYVGWNDGDVALVCEAGPILEPCLPLLVEDFYDEVERHPLARQVITGGVEQIQRLKGTLKSWLQDLLSGTYDAAYVDRRWKAGYRHVEIGLDQVYTNVALSRLRSGLIDELERRWQGDYTILSLTMRAIHRLLDLDLAIIEDAYQAEYTARREAAERLVTIGQVAGGIAHELRNPLNVMKTSVYYLLNARNPTTEKTREHLERIEKHVGLADGVITALTNFARLPLPELRPFSVVDLLREVVDSTGLRPNIQVNIESPAEIPHVLADFQQMRIVFSNLIRNAQDAMSDDGTLTISVTNQANEVRVDVTDTGHGMDESVLNRAMEPLFTTKARGIGLGLAMARAIVEKNNGSLNAVSERNQGSTFTVRLTSELPNC